MSSTILFYTLLHTVPVVVVGLITSDRWKLHLTASAMAAVAILIGSPQYAILDLLAIGIAWGVLAFAPSDKRTPPVEQPKVPIRPTSPPPKPPVAPTPSKPPTRPTPAPAPASREHRHALPTGHRLGEYRIDRYLGSGGFGITYLATDENLNIQVAIKEYLPSDYAVRERNHEVEVKSAADRDDFQWGRERFLEEARSLARFDHPNIVPVQRFLEAHGTSYIVMDYVEGEPLSELLKRKGTLTEAEIRRSVLPIADGLAEVHRAGLLHRDIKPGNIVVRTDGTPILIDFGSARQALGAKSRSVTSVVTPGYAPPEQYGTKSRQGPATDIYAFGAVLYRCVTGGPPDDAADRVIIDELAPAAKVATGSYSKNLLGAIDAALKLKMEDRPQSIAALLDDLSKGGRSELG